MIMLKWLKFYLLLLLVCNSCNIERKIVKEMYNYEKNQFLNPNNPYCTKILQKLKQNHGLIFKNHGFCDTFVIIDCFDNKYRNYNYKNKELYLSKYYICNYSGEYLNLVDSFKYTKINHKNQISIDKKLIDSIYNKSEINLRLISGSMPFIILQLVTIDKRKVKIIGINLNNELEVKSKI